MLNLNGLLRAPIHYSVTFKPTGMSKKHGRSRPEVTVTVKCSDKFEAASVAREMAAAKGLNGYAITNIKEVAI